MEPLEQPSLDLCTDSGAESSAGGHQGCYSDNSRVMFEELAVMYQNGMSKTSHDGLGKACVARFVQCLLSWYSSPGLESLVPP